MSKKKVKKMHIKRWKYNHRPRDTAMKALDRFPNNFDKYIAEAMDRFLNNFDKYIAEAMELFRRTAIDFFQKLADAAQTIGAGYEELNKK